VDSNGNLIGNFGTTMFWIKFIHDTDSTEKPFAAISLSSSFSTVT